MERNGIGSIFKMNINVFGLPPGMYASSSGVSLTAKFYTRHPDNAEYTPLTILKSAMEAANDGNCDDYLCVVDTTNLGYGRLMCDVKISYTDSETGKELSETKIIETDIELVKTA